MVEVSVIFFLAGLAIAVTVINALLKQAGREEYSYLVLLVGLIVALLRVLPLVAFCGGAERFQSVLGDLDEYFCGCDWFGAGRAVGQSVAEAERPAAAGGDFAAGAGRLNNLAVASVVGRCFAGLSASGGYFRA